MRSASVLLFLAALAVSGASPAAVPPGSTTLLLYDTVAKPFSLVNEVEPIAVLLTRFDTRVEKREAARATLADIEKADALIVVGIAGFPEMNAAVLEYLGRTKKPLMAVGAASSLTLAQPSMRGAKSTPLEKAGIHYRDREWKQRLDPFFPAPANGVEVLAKVTSPGKNQPLSWRIGSRFGFSALPGDPPLSTIFSDVLLDFYGVGKSPDSALLYIVQDYHPGDAPQPFRRLVDYFAHHKAPFVVTAQVRDIPAGLEITPREDYMDSLRYAQSRGGRIFLRGENSPEEVRKFLEEGIVITGAENAPAALELGNPTCQRTPGEAPVSLFSAVPLRRAEGGWLLPANVRGGLDGAAITYLEEHIRDIASMRGGLAGVVIPAWMTFQHMRDIVDAARSSHLVAVDPVTAFPVSQPVQNP